MKLLCCKYSGPLCDFRCTLLLQLHFNSSPDAYLAPIEFILCIMKKIVLHVSYMVRLHQGQDEHKGRSWGNCTENRIVV